MLIWHVFRIADGGLQSIDGRAMTFDGLVDFGDPRGGRQTWQERPRRFEGLAASSVLWPTTHSCSSSSSRVCSRVAS